MEFTVSKRDVASIVAATFPDYDGRQFRIREIENEDGLFSFDRTGWGDGSRAEYALIDLATLDMRHLAGAVLSSTEARVPEGSAIVEHSFFQGKDTGITIHVLLAHLAKILPGAGVHLD